MEKHEIIVPVDIKQLDDETLGIRWQDGHESAYPCDYLRKLCHCAACVDEWTGQRRLDPNEISEDVCPIEVQGIGRYGIRINWSDGHNTGIYTFKYLRQICPCDECKKSGD